MDAKLKRLSEGTSAIYTCELLALVAIAHWLKEDVSGRKLIPPGGPEAELILRIALTEEAGWSFALPWPREQLRATQYETSLTTCGPRLGSVKANE